MKHQLVRWFPRNRALPLLVLGVTLILWNNAGAWFGVPSYILPSPTQLLNTFNRDPNAYLHNTWITLRAGLLGFALGNALAIALATLFLYSRVLERALMPLILAIRSVPLVAVTPLLVLILGRGDTAKIIVVAIICFFPMLVNVAQGLTHVNRAALEMMDVLAAPRWQVYWKIRVPSALPMFFAALRITATSAILSAIVAEFIGTGEGLGSMMVEAFASYEPVRLWVGIVISTIVAMLLFGVAGFVEQRAIPWHESVIRVRPGAKQE